MKLVYIGGIAVGVLALLGLGLFIAQGPQPEIVVPAEVLFKIGPLNITNTLFTSWVVMALLIILTFAATRSMSLLPTGLQNFVEAVVGFLVAQIEDIAGEKNGRKFFTVVATIFLFVLVSNWFGLLPFFNSIGKTADVGHEIFAELASASPARLTLKDGVYTADKKFAGAKMQKSGSIVYAKPRAKTVDFTVKAGETPGRAMDRYIVFLARNFAAFDIPEAAVEDPTAEEIRVAADALKNSSTAPELLDASQVAAGGEAAAIKSPALGTEIAGVSFENSAKMAVVIPFFRGTFSDLNNTLALGIIAFVMIEIWGFQAQGFGYLKKFFDFSNPIKAFVGILELLSEFIRIVSFTFRLFGNIFAGEVLVLMLTFLMPFLFVDIIYGLELFVGFIQAAVFALLTLVFASMATEHHGEDEHHAGHQGEEATADAHHHQGAAQAH
ncbi:MAG: F0F1 ATP synthase subunit A [Chloroflexi bacterium]|nr:F0F1 ATP synthase subunit A [Chloroflexota bacterium]